MVKPPTCKIFADGACLADMLVLARNPLVKGFTTNPSLMRKAGVKDYEGFLGDVMAAISLPVSFEVTEDDNIGMMGQARKIAKLAREREHGQVYVKIPVSNSMGHATLRAINMLSKEGIKLNVTAVFTLAQVNKVLHALHPDVPAVISVFAGRIADTGRDPAPHMAAAKRALVGSRVQLLWASVREIYNVFQADQVGCDIVTVPHELLAKWDSTVGKDLLQYSLETVKMFQHDAQEAGYVL